MPSNEYLGHMDMLKWVLGILKFPWTILLELLEYNYYLLSLELFYIDMFSFNFAYSIGSSINIPIL